MIKLNSKTILCSALFLIALPLSAATWVLDPGESRVIFEYKYCADPYEGEFKGVEALFDIDPLKPGSCNFSVTIPIESIYVEDSPEAVDYLLDYELFDVDTWPTATFGAEKCRLESVSSFVADGTLTIRDQTHPLSFPFDFEITTIDGQVGFHLTSEVTIERLKYGVGQGYWANTGEIANDVTIRVDVYAVQQ